jgi:hypothetical protein
MRNTFLLLGIILILVFQSNAQKTKFDESILSEKGKTAYQTLLKVDKYALFGVGFGGETSEGELALDILVNEKNAIPALKTLVATATPEGVIYALVGLKMLDCECLKEQITIFKRMPEPKYRRLNEYESIDKGFIRTQSGCIISWEKKRDLIKQIERGRMVQIKISNYKANKNSEKNLN